MLTHGRTAKLTLESASSIRRMAGSGSSKNFLMAANHAVDDLSGLFQVIVVRNADDQIDSACIERRVVGDGLRGDFAVGNDDMAVVRRCQLGLKYTDILDRTRNTASFERSFRSRKAGIRPASDRRAKLLSGTLQCQADGKGCTAEDCNQRGDRNAEIADGDQDYR